MTDPAVAGAAAAILPEALDLSHRVHANPEIAFEEVQASRWTAELLERHGFEVTAPAGGLETAFVARWRGDRPGPVIAFAGEYDARNLYGEAAAYCESVGDRVSKILFEDLMKDEEGHIDFLETQLNLVEQLGLQLYAQKHMGGLEHDH